MTKAEVKRIVAMANETPDPFGMMPELYENGYSQSDFYDAVDESDRLLSEKTIKREKPEDLEENKRLWGQ